MKRFLRAFDWADLFIVLIGFAVVGLLQLTKTARDPLQSLDPMQIKSFGESSLFVPVSDRDSDADLVQIIASLKQDSHYFGAVATWGRGYAHAQGFGTLAAARIEALTACHQRTGDQCEIVLEIRADAPPALIDSALTLNFTQSQLNQQTAKGSGIRAFAVTVDGVAGQGAGTTIATATAAAKAALRADPN